jgi:hypothetical protein
MLHKNLLQELSICQQIKLVWKIPDISATRISTIYFVHTTDIYTAKKKSVNKREADEEVVFFELQKIQQNSLNQLAHDRADAKLSNIPDYNDLVKYMYIAKNAANWYTRKGTGERSWSRRMGVSNNEVMKTRTMNSTFQSPTW